MKIKILLQLSSFFLMLLLFYAFDGNEKKNTADGDDDKPAEEVYKNIQVLKGMPKKDLSMVMQFIRASLGVNCGFCHVHNEQTHEWNFESDSIEEKSTARKMITMVKSINKEHFEGFNAVSCFTCHQGKTNISRTPNLPQMPPNMESQIRDTTIPNGDVIIDNYLKALGNIDKIRNSKSRYSKGTVTGWDGKIYDIEIYQLAPDKYMQVLTGTNGTASRGFDGTMGWQSNVQGSSDLNGFWLEQMKTHANYTRDIDLKSKYKQVQSIGKDTVEGKNVYIVRGVVDDKINERLSFDISTGLLLRRKIYTKTIIGNIPVQTDYDDYRMVDGVMIPFYVHFSYLDPYVEASRTYTEIKFDMNMSKIKFSKPE